VTEPSIPRALRQLSPNQQGGAAAFDVDGVLWHGDVSEDFTRWMVARGHFDAGHWPVYEEAHRVDPARGCLEILKFYLGMTEAEIRGWVDRFWQEAPERRWIPRSLAALDWLKQLGYAVYLVSGTPSPILSPLPHHLPSAPDGILALDLEFDAQGRATGRSAGIPTVGAGKAQRLRAETRAPILLAVGNSSLDLEMLQLSSGVAWAINPDRELRALAEREGWLITREDEG
jgi:phosphoserine phosphatase